jgi:Ulp1 family protease
MVVIDTVARRGSYWDSFGGAALRNMKSKCAQVIMVCLLTMLFFHQKKKLIIIKNKKTKKILQQLTIYVEMELQGCGRSEENNLWSYAIEEGIPQQNDVWNCGVYMLACARYMFVKGKNFNKTDLDFTPSDFPEIRKTICSEILCASMRSIKIVVF